MALIPADVGLRLRSVLDAPQALAPVADVPSDLPELRPGQLFSARIQEAMPENTYRALVAGKSVTLSLPEGAKAGDTLELVVVDRTARSLVAQLAQQPGAAGAGAGYAHTTLSRTAQLISSLLVADGDKPAAAPLSRSGPLLAQPPTDARQLAASLSRAVTQSGLFYESHQVEWVTGQRPLAQLLAEPQGRHSSAATLAANPLPAALADQADAVAGSRPGPGSIPAAADDPALPSNVANAAAGAAAADEAAVLALQRRADQPVQVMLLQAILNLDEGSFAAQEAAKSAAAANAAGAAGAAGAAEAGSGPDAGPLAERRSEAGAERSAGAPAMAAEAAKPSVAQSLFRALFGGDDAAAAASPAQATPAAAVPDDVRPLVQQQLDAVATSRLVWHGEVWPQQEMEWEVEREARQPEAGNEDELDAWNTRLHLTTPRLGSINARLSLTEQGVRVIITTPYDASASDLRSASPALETALAAAGVPLLALQVKHEASSGPAS